MLIVRSATNRHSTYSYPDLYKNYNERLTYLNPKDSDGDNVYELSYQLKDIRTLEMDTIDMRLEILSHQVFPYNQFEATRATNSVDVNLTIPKEALVGGELLTVEGAKGFKVRTSQDINLGSATLSGSGADKFEIVENTIKLTSSLADSNLTEYNLTLAVSDSEGVESTNNLNIKVTSIFD